MSQCEEDIYVTTSKLDVVKEENEKLRNVRSIILLFFFFSYLLLHHYDHIQYVIIRNSKSIF